MRNQAGKAHYVGTDYNKRGQQSSLYILFDLICAVHHWLSAYNEHFDQSGIVRWIS